MIRFITVSSFVSLESGIGWVAEAVSGEILMDLAKRLIFRLFFPSAAASILL